jgi:hypothetical protein
MSLQVQLALRGDLTKFIKDVNGTIARAARNAVEAYAKRLQLALRDDTRQGGLGDRVANAWRLNTYTDQQNPAALIYTRAPLIVSAFGADTTIVPHDGHLWLALPTDNVPSTYHHAMTPAEVQIKFNQKLIFRGVQNAGVALAYIKKGKGRRAQLVLMFVLVRQVHLRQRLNWQRLMADAKAGFEQYFGEQIAAALAD